MTEYIEAMCERLSFPASATACYVEAYGKLIGIKTCKSGLERLISEYESTNAAEFEKIGAFAEQAERLSGIHRYTVMMLVMLCFTRHLKVLYDKNGYSERMYYDVLTDLRCKNGECFRLHGIYGSFVCRWELKIFNLLLFSFGRLEFEPRLTDSTYTLKSGTLPQGTAVLSVHIPSSGPLSPDLCRDSLHRAEGFFENRGSVIFHCKSWLLYPQNRDIITPPSNILKFAELFETVCFEDSTDDLWRIFETQPTENVAALPEDTSLRRDFKRRLLSGLPVGVGTGFITERNNYSE